MHYFIAYVFFVYNNLYNIVLLLIILLSTCIVDFVVLLYCLIFSMLPL